MPNLVPEPARRPFPRSAGWGGTSSWAEVFRYHADAHARGERDFRVTFDDQDRLCVTCHARGPYSVRVPLTMVRWAEAEMAERTITAEPAFRDQLRQVRGPGGSRERDGDCSSLDTLAEIIAGRAGVPEDTVRPHLPDGLCNLRFAADLPVEIRDLPMGGVAVGFLARETREFSQDHWVASYGCIIPDRPVSLRKIAGPVSRLRAGGVMDQILRRVDEIEEADRALHARMGDTAPEPG